MKVYYVRHGQSEANVRGVFAGGGTDTPLTELGKQQARDVAKDLRSKKIDVIVASPMSRTLDTAKIIAEEINLPQENIIQDVRIKEYNTGEMAGFKLEGMTSERLIAAKGAENPHSFARRVRESLIDVRKQEANVLIVGHGGTMKIIECLKTGRDPSTFFEVPKMTNANIIEIDLSWLGDS